MLGSTFVETAIGLSLVYLTLSMMCSIVYEWLAKQAMWRANMLRSTIEEMLDERACKELYEHKIIQSLGTKSMDGSPFVASMAEFHRRRGADKSFKWEDVWVAPSYIPSRLFASVLADLSRQSKLSIKLTKALEAVTNHAAAPSAEWNDAVAKWFDDVMARTSSRYTRRTQFSTFVIAVVLSYAFDADSLLIAQRLQRDKPLRDAIVASAGTYVKEHPELTSPAPSTPQGDAPPAPSASSHAPAAAARGDNGGKRGDTADFASAARYFELSRQLEKLSLPIGWPSTAELDKATTDKRNADDNHKNAEDALTRALDAARPGMAGADKALADLEKAKANAAAAKAADDAASHAYDDLEARNVASWGSLSWASLRNADVRWRMLGFLLTALATSLGARFWFDTLGKLFNIRGAGEKGNGATK